MTSYTTTLHRFLEDGHESHSDSDLSGLFYNESTGERIYYDDDDHKKDPQWGLIIGAALIVQAVTLAGLALVAGSVLYRGMTGKTNTRLLELSPRWSNCIIPAFSAGAFIATVVFLLIPEGLELLAASGEEEGGDDDHSGHNHRLLEDHEDHSDHDGHASVSWKFGVAFIVGFLFPFILGMMFPNPTHDDKIAVPQEESNKESQTARDQESGMDEFAVDDPVEEPITKPKILKIDAETDDKKCIRNTQLAVSILVGDALHNFCDGVFLGTAFLLCDETLGWTVAIATVYHELAQEIADFTLLVSHCNFSVLGALTVNFVSGFSVIIGAALVAWMDLTNPQVGFILSLSAGVFIHVAACECIPRVNVDKALALLCFALGAVPIGLVLLNHPHCESH